jgi:hypothetical protein
MTKKTIKKKSNGSNGARPVLVTTAHRGVFFGYADKTDGETITLKRARLCVYWSADCKGFMGLAANGPTKGCKIGPAADITIRNITAVLECTPDAVNAWEEAPWG